MGISPDAGCQPLPILLDALPISSSCTSTWNMNFGKLVTTALAFEGSTTCLIKGSSILSAEVIYA